MVTIFLFLSTTFIVQCNAFSMNHGGGGGVRGGYTTSPISSLLRSRKISSSSPFFSCSDDRAAKCRSRYDLAIQMAPSGQSGSGGDQRNEDMYNRNFDGDNNPRRGREVRTREFQQSAAERELRSMKYEDEDEYYYYDEEYGDYEEEDYYYEDEKKPRKNGSDESGGAVGNFWSNPMGAMDTNPKTDVRRRGGGNTRPQRTRVDPRDRDIGQERALPRRRTFRSGNPPPPNVIKEFYDNIFWYGFDPDETTSAADRTMFGGTKGKFNGLGLLSDINKNAREELEDRDRDRNRRTKRSTNAYDDYDKYYDDDEDEAYYEEYYDEEWDEYDERERKLQQTQRGYERDNGGVGRRLNSSPPAKSQQRSTVEDFMEDDYDDVSESSSSSSSRPPPVRDQRPRVPRGGQSVSYRQAPRPRTAGSPKSRRPARGREGGSRKKQSSGRRKESIASSWFNDDEDDDVRGDQRNRKRKREENDGSEQSPFYNILDKVFQVDPDEVKYQAEDYDRKLRLGKSRRSRGNVETSRDSRAVNPRDGYAYRYVMGDDDGDGEDGFNRDDELSYKQQQPSKGDDIIDVEATVQPPDSPKSENLKKDRPQRQQSWADRAFAYELVPPKGIKAWGAEGEIDGGIDARTHAARLAKEEIQAAKETFEKKEVAVLEAEKELIEVKKKASALKKKILLQDDRRRIAVIRDELRMVNFDIEEEARKLRRAKGEALLAIDKLEAIELRYWALLRQIEADQELEEAKDNEPIQKD